MWHFWGHWGQRTINVEFWGWDLEILQSFLKVWLPTSKKYPDLCMTNCSKVLIYLTLLYFLLHYLQVYSKIWNIAKSNKSEPFVIKRSTLPFGGEEPNFQELLPNFEVAASKFRDQLSFDLKDLKRPKWAFKKMSRQNHVSPIDTKNSIPFFVQFFWGYPGLLDGSGS